MLKFGMFTTGTVARRSLLEKEDNGMYGDNDMNVFAGDYGGIRGQGMSGPSSDADQGMSMANTGGFILVWNTYEGNIFLLLLMLVLCHWCACGRFHVSSTCAMCLHLSGFAMGHAIRNMFR